MHDGIRAALARYTQALDDGRTDDVVACFCPDGAFEYPGLTTATGHDELRSTYAGWAPRRPQRHLVFNTLVSRLEGDEAEASSDVVLVVLGKEGAWSVQFVARYHDVLHADGDDWRFHHRRVEVVGA